MRTAVLALLLFTAVEVSCQTWIWDSILPPSRGIMLAGDARQSIYSFSADSDRVTKWNSQGIILWQVQLPGGARIGDVVCSADTSFYVGGEFSGQLAFTSVTLQSVGMTDIFLAKYSRSGTLLWAQRIGSKGDDEFGDVCVTRSRPLLTGAVRDSLWVGSVVHARPATKDLFVLRLTTNGNVDAVTLASPVTHSTVPDSMRYSFGHEIAANDNGNVAVFAYINGQVQIDTLNLYAYNYAGYGKHLIVFDTLLKPMWGKYGLYQNYLDWTGNLNMTSAGDIIYSRSMASNHSGPTATINKQPLTGGPPAILFTKAGAYTRHNFIGDLALDSCDNIYFTGGRSLSYPQLQYQSIYFVFAGQVSTGGSLHWLREDSCKMSARGRSIGLLGPNHCMVSVNYYDTLHLQSNLITQQGAEGFGYAVIQTTVAPPVNVSHAYNTIFCSGVTTTLQASSNGAISWYNTSAGGGALGTGPNFITPVLPAGHYTYYADASSCTMTTVRVPVTVTVLPSPTITVNNGAVCVTGSYTINPSGAQIYYYSSGSAVVSPTANTVYTVYGVSPNGCNDSAQCTVNIVALPQPTITTSINFMCPGQTAVLTGSGAFSYTWNTGQVSQTIAVSPTVHTNYSVMVTDTNNCVNTTHITQFVADCVGTKEQYGSWFNFYPNPTGGQLAIATDQACRIEFTDATGRVVHRCHLVPGTNPVNLEHLQKGLYFISRTGERQAVHKVILK